jgi:hypothetical protein
MKDMIILSTIIVFWFLLALGLAYTYEDELIITELQEGNSSYIIDVDTSQSFNITDQTEQDFTETKGFISMLFRILTFRIPRVSSIPNGLITFIEFFNFLLVLLFGLMIYRLIRSGAG